MSQGLLDYSHVGLVFGQWLQKKFRFFASYLDKYLQNKSNKTRGLPPTKRSFKVINLTVRRRFLYPIPNLSQRDKGIKLTFSPKSHVAFLMVSDPITQSMEKLSGSVSLGGNLFGSVSIKFLNWSSNLDLTKPCVNGILGSWGGETNGFSFSPMAFSLWGSSLSISPSLFSTGSFNWVPSLRVIALIWYLGLVLVWLGKTPGV